MRALSLFTGIGGIDLAAEWAGIKTVAMCEREPFCQKVLSKHWPNIPIYDDVCTLTKERLEADGIGTIELIHGGYPCQPFSTAGERKGENDDRHLWPEVKRLLETIRPRWFIGENVAGHITLGLDDVLSDLDNLRYTAQPFVIPAAAVGARHRRDRIFIVAYAGYDEPQGWNEVAKGYEHSSRREAWSEFTPCCSDVSNANSKGQQTRGCEKQAGWNLSGRYDNENVANTASIRQQRQRELIESFDTTEDKIRQASESLDVRIREQWAVEPRVGRVANGIPDRIHRLKALGNAVVPQQIYPILAAIKQIDDMLKVS